MLAVATLVLGVGVGCGGGSGETTSDITKAQFVKKANAICADYKKQRSAAADEIFNSALAQKGPERATQGAEYESELQELGEKLLKEKTIPLLREQQEELENLGAPADDGDQVEAMMASLDKAIGEIENEDFETVLGSNQLDPFEKESDKYGLSCEVI